MLEEINTSDPYFMAYHIYSLALKDEDMNESLTKALYFSKLCFNADNVILYKQDENGDYVHKHNSALMNTNSTVVTAILNSARSLLEKQKKYELNISFDNMHYIAFVEITVHNKKYAIALTGNKEFKNLDEKFLKIFTQTMGEIFGKL